MLKVKQSLKKYIESERKTFFMLKEVMESQEDGKTSEYTKGILVGLQLALTNFKHEFSQLENKKIVDFWSTGYILNNK